jgi:hypothetical protein
MAVIADKGYEHFPSLHEGNIELLAPPRNRACGEVSVRVQINRVREPVALAPGRLARGATGLGAPHPFLSHPALVVRARRAWSSPCRSCAPSRRLGACSTLRSRRTASRTCPNTCCLSRP